MADVFVTYRIPESGIELLQTAGHKVTIWDQEELIGPAQLREVLRSYAAIITMLTEKISAADINQAGQQLKIIANYAVGFDNVDLAAATSRGIIVTNTPDVLTGSVAEHTVALLLALSRRIVEADKFTRAGLYHGWRPMMFLGTDLSNKTLGIVGLGRIGEEVARRAKDGLEMHIAYNDLQSNLEFEHKFKATYYKNIDDMLPRVDAVSLHVPLLDSTRHLINAKRLELMKKSAFLINTSRGAVIDEAALVQALQNNVIRGAALDVFEDEPDIKPGLSELENVILTPHIASATIETRAAMSDLTAKNIIEVLAERTPLTPVT